jgi:hypothetical protein
LHMKLYMYHVLIFDPAEVYVWSHDAASNWGKLLFAHEERNVGWELLSVSGNANSTWFWSLQVPTHTSWWKGQW